MERDTGTIFKVYLLAKGDPKLEEGYVQLWKHKGKLMNGKRHPFNNFDRVGRRIRTILEDDSIAWREKT